MAQRKGEFFLTKTMVIRRFKKINATTRWIKWRFKRRKRIVRIRPERQELGLLAKKRRQFKHIGEKAGKVILRGGKIVPY